MAWDNLAVVRKLLTDVPLFYYADEEGVRQSAALGYHFPVGDFSMAVGPDVLSWIASRLRDDMTTIETGAGYTTVVFAALAKHHYCCTFSQREVDRIRVYLRSVDIPDAKVTFLLGSTDKTLPSLDLEQCMDFAYIDGCHGYPFPSLDWHYVDKLLKVGGVLGMDNVELRPVREHCDFLEENGTYKLVGRVAAGYMVRFTKSCRTPERSGSTNSTVSQRKTRATVGCRPGSGVE